jgi:hypothetical protein
MPSSRRHRFPIVCALAAASSFLLVSGCGGESGTDSAEPAGIESPAQREWESQVGREWEEYEQGFVAGWVEGCKAVHEAVAAEFDEDYADTVLVECSGAPPSGYGGAPIQVPAEPRAAGHADGVAEACYVPPEVTRPVEPEC